MQGWWGHLANQITQGLCVRVAHARVARTGVACTGVVRARVVGTLIQSDYTRVARKGGRDTQRRVARAGVAHKGCRM